MFKHERSKRIILAAFLMISLVALAVYWLSPSTPQQPASQGQATLPVSERTPDTVIPPKGSPAQPSPQSAGPPVVPLSEGSTVVRAEDSAAIIQYSQANSLAIKEVEDLPDGTAVITMSEDPNGEKVKAMLRDIPDTRAGPNYVYRLLATPNDPIYPQWYTDIISAPAAWGIVNSSSSVSIAVVDTGFAMDHEDLTSQWATNSGETGGGKETNGLDDDLNGKVDDWRGWDFVGSDNNPSTSAISHGTEVAGLAGATGNNSKGVASINWNVKVLPLRILDNSGNGTTANVISAFSYARSLGVKVINASFGSTAFDLLLQAEIDIDIATGITVVAAAGNCGNPATYIFNGCDELGQIIYPANYGPVLAVGATDSNDNRASFSSYGPNLDIMAPGTGTIRTPAIAGSDTTTAYSASVSGTSYSAPIVSGLIALAKGRFSSATPDNLIEDITDHADKVTGMSGQNRTDFYGYGRINAPRSVAGYHWQLSSVSHSSGTAIMEAGQTQSITIRALNDGLATWTKSGEPPVRLGTWPPERGSAVYHSSWLNPLRPTELQESSVSPGATGTFTFTVRALNGGEFTERVNLVAEGWIWLNDPGAQFYIKSIDDFRWQLLWHAHSTGTANIGRNNTFDLTVKARNIGSNTWYKHGDFPVRLGTEAPKNRGSHLYYSNWMRDFRPTGLQENTVPPGAEGTFIFTARAPSTPGEYHERFNLVAENLKWLNDTGLSIYVNSQ